MKFFNEISYRMKIISISFFVFGYSNISNGSESISNKTTYPINYKEFMNDKYTEYINQKQKDNQNQNLIVFTNENQPHKRDDRNYIINRKSNGIKPTFSIKYDEEKPFE